MTLPILAGFYPDPTACRVGEWIYLANSTFEYVPGVPIHRSRDLVEWEFVGHALVDAAPINGGSGFDAASAGIFAPTLRFHDGLFWMITTSIRDIGRGQLITHAEDPAGPWSEPIYVPDTGGIDPDLAWLEDGTCLMTWRGNTPPGIHQLEIDPLNGDRLGEERLVWEGTDMKDTEGPHLFEKDGWWYLLVAEGGTHVTHGVSIARSRDPRGPFESHPANPIFSHRSLPHPVQATGHPDMLELADGSWAMVYLGTRPGGAYPGFHVNGRETFVAGVEWVDGWPVVDEDRFDVPDRDRSWEEAFVGEALDPRWVAPGKAPADVARLEGGGVRVVAGRDADSAEQLDLLCARIPAIGFAATAEVAAGDACLSVRMDALHWVGVERVGDVVRGRAVSTPFDQVFGEIAARTGDLLTVRSVPSRELYGRLGPDLLEPGIVRDGEFMSLGEVDGRYVSTEVAGGFTGRMLALEGLGGEAAVARVTYRDDPRG